MLTDVFNKEVLNEKNFNFLNDKEFTLFRSEDNRLIFRCDGSAYIGVLTGNICELDIKDGVFDYENLTNFDNVYKHLQNETIDQVLNIFRGYSILSFKDSEVEISLVDTSSIWDFDVDYESDLIRLRVMQQPNIYGYCG